MSGASTLLQDPEKTEDVVETSETAAVPVRGFAAVSTASVWPLIDANRRSYDSPVPSPRAVADRVRASEAAQAKLEALQASTSWRLTAPFRQLVDTLQSWRRKPQSAPASELPPEPLDYAAWIASEEPKYGMLRRPERGRRRVSEPKLGLVLLCPPDGEPDQALLAAPPSFCTILLLRTDSMPPADPGHARVMYDQLPPQDSGGAIISLATSRLNADFLCFLDVRDRLAPNALDLSADVLARHPDLDLVFADEDWLDGAGRRQRPFLKPGWDPELQRGRDLVGPFAFFRTSLVRAATVSAGLAWHYDLACQVAASSRPERIHHIPAVLCHRSVALPGQGVARRDVALAQLKRDDVRAELLPVAGHPDLHRVVYAVPDPEPLVSIIVPTRDRADLLRVCASGVLKQTRYDRLELLIVDNGTVEADALSLLETLSADRRVRVLRQPAPFNWSALNNHAASHAAGDVLLLLNNDVAVLHHDWLRELVSHVVQPGVGAVGAKLLYPNGRIQHAAITTDMTGLPRHLLRHVPRDSEGPFGLLKIAREVWGVTGACLATPKAVFSRVGGLNESFPIGSNDVDLCLRLRACGYRIIWTPWAELEHRELASRGLDVTPEQHERVREELDRLARDWGSLMINDPYLHPALDPADDRLPFRRTAAVAATVKLQA